MAFIRSWPKDQLYQSLFTNVLTASGDVTTQPTLMFYVLCTHTGAAGASPGNAVIDLWDNGVTGTKVLHLTSAGGDLAPFGLSLTKPILFENKLTLAITATGATVSMGYYNYSA